MLRMRFGFETFPVKFCSLVIFLCGEVLYFVGCFVGGKKFPLTYLSIDYLGTTINSCTVSIKIFAISLGSALGIEGLT